MNELYCGNNLEVMKEDIEEESVDLIYLDPPFFTKRDYELIWGDEGERRGFKDTEWYNFLCPECDHKVMEGEKFCPECRADLKEPKVVRKDDIEGYIDWMRPRLIRMKEILKPNGSIYLHCDDSAGHHLKILMDEVFGVKSFKTQISWRRCGPKGCSNSFANNSDYILYYTKDEKKFTFNIQYGEYSKSTLKNFKYDDKDGRGKYSLRDTSKPDEKGYKYDLGYGEKMPKKGYRWKLETMLQKIENNLIVLRPGKVPVQKKYLSSAKGVPYDNIWTDISNVKNPRYPTEKPEALLERIILSSSNPGDVVFDPFCGCGTSAAVAQKLRREYIGIDSSQTACKVIAERIHYNGMIYGLKYTLDEMHKMDPNQFQALVCIKLKAKNTSNQTTGSTTGQDGGIDGIVKSTFGTEGFGGALIQVKRSKSIGVDTVKKLQSTMVLKGKKIGFIVALSFGKGAEKIVKEFKELGYTIYLIDAKGLNEFSYKDLK